jgi:diguanylate cyclase (GGDEF)-like protein
MRAESPFSRLGAMQFSRPQRACLWSNQSTMNAPRTAAASTSPAPGAEGGWLQKAGRIGGIKLALIVVPLALLLAAVAGEAIGQLSGLVVGVGAALAAAAALPALLVSAAVFWRVARAPAAAAPAIDVAATRDALTGAFTQRHFVAATDREWARIRRHAEDAALLMVDVDHFRAVNDKHGPACGDAALVEITRIASATLRQYDLLARFGGGVLVVYLPHTDPIGALDVAERIRERVAGYRLTWEGQSVGVTVSIGVAAVGADHQALDGVIADAGTALREAKAAGRNCVRAAPVQPRRVEPSGRPAHSKRSGA